MLKNGAFKLSNNIAVYRFKRKFYTTIQEGIAQAAKSVTSKVELNVNINNYFKEIDLRVGKIVEIEEMKDSENIYCCKIDIGEKNLREIGSGIRKHIKKEELFNSQVIVFANLKPRKLGGYLKLNPRILV